MPGQCPNVKGGGHLVARREKLLTEARMNAGRNYNGPKVMLIIHGQYQDWDCCSER